MKLVAMGREEFPAVYEQLEKNFIREERRDRADAEAILECPQYTVYHAVEGDEKVGFITVWELEGFAFAEHFVIFEPCRNRGLGAEVLRLLAARYDRIVLEAEPPVGDIQRRRLAFYGRNGFCQNDRKYLQPSYRKGGEGVELVLMSYPDPVSDFDGTVSQIYQTVYGVNL